MCSFLVKAWVIFLWYILKLIHLAYSGYESFDLRWLLLKRKFIDFLHLPDFDSHVFLSNFVRKLEKSPSHLAVIIGDEEISLKDFSNLVVWCLAAKISFVSFYDYSGYLKANEDNYFKYLIEKRKVDSKCLIFDLEKWVTVNGVVHKTHLNVLSLEEGKSLFVKLTKKLIQNVISNKYKLNEINETLITNELQRYSGLPEPDLGVVSGKIFGTFSFLPWHIRVTEFFQIKSLQGIKVSEFASILSKYSSCSQRFGK